MGPLANRLAQTASPYLRQHADNPVDWYPWGDEARRRARELDRPILLSIGYAACHWCHVMAHESFSDPDIAAVLNASFVAVKVDREEHPEIDAIYQMASQMATGQGGWPLTAFLTPELAPFYVGTYFPPHTRLGRTGLLDVAQALATAWRDDRPRVLAVAGDWQRSLRGGGTPQVPSPGAALERGLAGRAAAALAEAVDPIHGGFGPAPKFPNAAALEAMLRAGGRPAERAVFTLRSMAAGGICDQLGGGFHRYSTDRAWLVPHFEKMLYDNALLPPLYLAAYQRCGDPEVAAVATDALDYLLRDLAAPEGAFYCAEDADSPDSQGRPREGAFYTWTPGEVEAALGDAELARDACQHFGIRSEGNFEGRRTVPHLHAMSLDPGPRRTLVRERMLAARASRPRPQRDEKVLTGWNGLAIAALAQAGRILGRPEYVAAATRCATFLAERMATPEGGLWRRHHAGVTGISGTLEDYAYLACGLVDLYEATLERRWLGWGIQLTRALVARFWDPAEGTMFLTEDRAEELIVRPRDDVDSGTPSPQSWALMVLLRLAPLARERTWPDIADRVLSRLSTLVREHPRAVGSVIAALDRATADGLDVVLSGPEGPEASDWRAKLADRHLPNLSLSRVAADIPGVEGIPEPWEGRQTARPTLWVCLGARCLPPASTWAEVEATVDEAVPPL